MIYRRVFTFAAVLAAFFMAAFPGAAAAQPVCGSRQSIVATLDKNYAEAPVSMGVTVGGANHFLATATVIEPALGAYQKRGPETVDVVGRSVTITRPAINKPVTDVREQKYIEANAEYIKRGLALTGGKVRGSTPDQALTAAAMKETQRGGAKAGPLATLHDRLGTLKDAIEIAADPSIINVTDDGHWV